MVNVITKSYRLQSNTSTTSAIRHRKAIWFGQGHRFDWTSASWENNFD